MFMVRRLSGPREAVGAADGYTHCQPKCRVSTKSSAQTRHRCQSLSWCTPVTGWKEADREPSREFPSRVTDLEESHAGRGFIWVLLGRAGLQTCLYR